MSQDNRERTFGALMIILLGIGGIIFALWVTGNTGKKFEITTAECPMLEQKVVSQFVNFEGWKCEINEEYTTDLLQPSGVWVNKNLSCWKLETPIEEYRMQECRRTGDDYWCKRDN